VCGIVGFFKPKVASPDFPSLIKNALSFIQHRGPDGSGYMMSDDFIMGTVRLAILDPKAGVQPVTDEQRRYWLCYNGEIYNYRELKSQLEKKGHQFLTNCDTEVVLKSWLEWGEECLSHFNGGFAFALYDIYQKRLVIARDKFGKRPLFYYHQGESLYFASEMKAFKAIPGFSFEQDPEQLGSILLQWTPLPHQTGFKNIHSLPMGCFLSFQSGKLIHYRYDTLSFDSTQVISNEKLAKEKIRSALDKSVSLRLRSDVDVGIYLSGGIDSAIIAHLASKYATKDLHTFSVTFEDSDFDESSDQKLVSDHIGTKHINRHITYKDMVDAFPHAVYHAEIPAFRNAFVPMYLLSKLTREHNIKVILSGEGADEAFLGYDLFKETILRKQWNNLSDTQRIDHLRNFYPHLAHFSKANTAAVAGLYQQYAEETMPGLFSHEMRFQNGRFSARLLKKELGINPFDQIIRMTANSKDYAQMSAVHKAQWLEYKTLLSGYLLSTQGERMSLAHGVENRCPFLDSNVIDIASATNLKFDEGFQEKRLLREAFREYLPDSIVEKRKFPYRSPDAESFVDQKPDYLDLILSDSELEKIPFINKKFTTLLTKKILNTPSEKIATKEQQTFMFLLSVAMIRHLFESSITSAEKLASTMDVPIQKMVDLRTNV
jgi:asparagine synthase (glutamine-hydrolysing)